MEITLRVTNDGGSTVETTVDDIRINKKLSDLIEIEKKYNNFTWEFEVVGDKDFNNFMNYAYSVNSQYNFDPNKSLNANVTISNSGSLIEGSLRLLNTSIVENGNIIYTVQLFGYLRDLFSIMDDYTLSSLDFSEYNHQRTIDHIKENVEDDKIYVNGTLIEDDPTDRRGYVYPHIIYNSLDDAETHLYLNNLFPGIYFKTLIEKTEETLNLDFGQFLKSDFFDNVIIPYTADNIKKTDEQINDQTTRIGTTEQYDLTGWRNHGSSWWKNSLYPKQVPPGRPDQFIDGLSLDDESSDVINSGNDYQFQDNLNSWTGDRYVCQKAGYYDVRFNGKLRCQFKEVFGSNIQYNGGGSLEYYYRLRINGQVVDESYNANDGGMTLFITPPSGSYASPWTLDDVFVFNVSQNNVFLEEGDVVNLEYGFRFSGATNWAGNNELIEARLLLDRSEVVGSTTDYTAFEVVPSDNNSYGGEEFRLSSILPDDLTINDFFQDLVKMFNLVVIPEGSDDDGVRRFNILPENEYFNSDRSTVKDLNELIDQNSNLTILPMNESNFKQYILKLQDDSDVYNKDFKDMTSETYGRKRLNVTNDFTNDKKIIQPSNFATSIISDEYTPDRPSVYFLKEDLSELSGPKIRLLKTKKISTPNWQIWRAPDSSERVNLSSYIYAGTWDDPDNPTFNYNFSTSDKVYHSTLNAPENTFYSRFWKQKIENIINPDAKRITIQNAYMSYEEYVNFDFRDIYTLDGIKVRIVSLGNYNPTIERVSIEAYTILEDFDFTLLQRTIDNGKPLDPFDPIDAESVSSVRGLTNEKFFDKPYTYPERLNKLRRNLNSNSNSKSIVSGNRSIIKDRSTNVVNNGNKVNILDRVSNVIVSDDNKSVKKNGMYVANTKLEEGLKSLKWNSVYIINGNDNVWKTNDTDVMSGGEDSVRNKGGIRHDRIIMNGNIQGSSLFGGSSDGISV